MCARVGGEWGVGEGEDEGEREGEGEGVGDAIGTSQLKSTPRMAPAVDLHCLAEIHDQIAQPQEVRD